MVRRDKPIMSEKDDGRAERLVASAMDYIHRQVDNKVSACVKILNKKFVEIDQIYEALYTDISTQVEEIGVNVSSIQELFEVGDCDVKLTELDDTYEQAVETALREAGKILDKIADINKTEYLDQLKDMSNSCANVRGNLKRLRDYRLSERLESKQSKHTSYLEVQVKQIGARFDLLMNLLADFELRNGKPKISEVIKMFNKLEDEAEG